MVGATARSTAVPQLLCVSVRAVQGPGLGGRSSREGDVLRGAPSFSGKKMNLRPFHFTCLVASPVFSYEDKPLRLDRKKKCRYLK